MSKRKPNIILLLIDDMGWKDVGFMGSTYYETPLMDRLASQGMVFHSAYANPNCAPSRASLMCGLYPPRHGIYTVGSPERGPSHLRKLIPPPNQVTLDPQFTTMAEMLKADGYTCGHVGKWHLGEGPLTGPEGRGFDVNIAGIHKGQPPAGYFSPYEISTLPEGPEKEYLTDRLTDEAITFIEGNVEQPFFLYFAHYAVHKPLQAKAEMIEKYKHKEASQGQDNPVYAAMIESTDQSAGRIVDKLEQLGIREDTVIFFISDNGGLGGYAEEGLTTEDVTCQKPLRGGKGMMYEGGIRVPMTVSWPGVIGPGTSCNTPVCVNDFFPTIMEMAGISDTSKLHLDGESMMPLLQQRDEWSRETLYWHLPGYLEGGEGLWRNTPSAALRHHEWKLIEFFEDHRLELYNLETDLGEQHNLASELPEKTAELYKLMLEWRESMKAPMPVGLNPDYGVHLESCDGHVGEGISRD